MADNIVPDDTRAVAERVIRQEERVDRIDATVNKLLQAIPPNIETRLQELAHEIAAERQGTADKVAALAIETSEKATIIAKETAVANKPPWQVILTGVGVLVSVMATIGWMALSPIQSNIAELGRNVVSKGEQEVRWHDYERQHGDLESRVSQLKEDLEKRDKEILSLDSTFIPRVEFDNLKTERDKTYVTQQQMRELDQAREALYVSKDQFNAVEKRMDQEDKMLDEMGSLNMTKEAFNAWKTERDKLLDTINQRIDKIYGLIQEANRRTDEIDKIYRQKAVNEK